jgi:hypothetical protein
MSPGNADAPVARGVEGQKTAGRIRSIAPFEPRLIRKSQLRVQWLGVVLNSAWTGPAGMAYYRDDEGTQLLEHRDASGRLRGVLVLYAAGDLLLMVDPERQRQGICTSLLEEAERRGMAINYARQSYTRAGWRAVRRHLAKTRTTPAARQCDLFEAAA